MKIIYLLITTTLFVSSPTIALANTDHHTNHNDKQQSQPEQRIQATGVIKQIDLINNKVTIIHEPIAALNWPAMTMRFTAQDQTLINALKINDHVNFEFVQQGNLSWLRSITLIK